MIDSIQPILTKVDPAEENTDVDVIGHFFAEQLSEEIRVQKAADGLLEEQKLEPDEEGEEEKDADAQEKMSKYDQLDKFYQQFAKKLKIYDPLERRIP